jgi:hypothetical protein
VGKKLCEGGYRAGGVIRGSEHNMYAFVIFVGFAPFEQQLGMV